MSQRMCIIAQKQPITLTIAALHQDLSPVFHAKNDIGRWFRSNGRLGWLSRLASQTPSLSRHFPCHRTAGQTPENRRSTSTEAASATESFAKRVLQRCQRGKHGEVQSTSFGHFSSSYSLASSPLSPTVLWKLKIISDIVFMVVMTYKKNSQLRLRFLNAVIYIYI